jgi:hypothetical protein
MRVLGGVLSAALGLGLLLVVGRWLGFEGVIREHLLDWVMGALCFAWLLVLLKAPWDLYFQAHTVAFEQARARERGIPILDGRESYIEEVRRRLLYLALGAHALSAILAAGVAFFTHGAVGYWFAGFFLISTLFRPLLAGYYFLWEKLKALLTETNYPREDVIELRDRVKALEESVRVARETDEAREEELMALRARLAAIGAEFEGTLSRLTDQKAVIDGLQAIARLIARSAAE